MVAGFAEIRVTVMSSPGRVNITVWVVFGIALALAATILYFVTRKSDGGGGAVDRTPVAKVGAPQFFLEYDANALAADKKYKGKFVEVQGSVRIVSKDNNGKYYIGFECIAMMGMDARDYNQLPARERRWFDEGAYPANVIGYISPSAESHFAEVKQFQVVTITGKVIGRKANHDVWHDYVVELEDCHLTAIQVKK